MKILIFNTLYYPNLIGGAEKSVQLLAEGLLNKGEEPIVVCTANKDYIDYVNGVKVYYVKMPNLYWAYQAKEEKKYKKPIWHLIDSYNPFNRKIANIIDNEKPDVIHTNNLAGFSVSVWKLATKKNIRLVHTLRDHYLLCPKSTMFNEKINKNCEMQCFTCKLYSVPKKKISRFVDVVVGISKYILEKHLKFGYFRNAKKEVIYNGIEIPNIKRKPENKQKNEIIFGYVGRLSKPKGIEFMLEHFNNINIENVKLFIFGKGITHEYEKQLKENYKSEKIIFKGYQKTENIYSSINILIVPSLWHEPFGRIIPEANSYNIPVLVSNRGGLPELVKDGKNGYIFDPEKDGDFEEKLKLVIKNYKSSKFEFDINEFLVDNIVGKYIDIYKKLFNL